MALPPGIDVDELTPYLGTATALDAGDQAFLEFLLQGVCDYAAQHTGRTLTPNPAGTSPENATITITKLVYDNRFRLPDARTITTVTADDVELTTGQYRANVVTPGGTIVYLDLLERQAKSVVVTGQFGFSEVPADLRDAIYTHTARNYRERDAMYADQVELPDGGSVAFFRQLPPRVKLVYDAYRVRPWGLVG